MLYKETVSKEMWELLLKLMRDEQLKDFVLVGGTSLSLQIGHRLSIDIDLFTTKEFDVDRMHHHLKKEYSGIKRHLFPGTVLADIAGIKVDIIRHKYPWQDEINEIEGIRLASPIDIGAMKLHAIVQSGERIKDFIDMYYLLEKYPLQEYLNAYERKYDGNPYLACNALQYHDHIDMEQKVVLLKDKETKWSVMRNRLNKSVVFPNQRFAQKIEIHPPLPPKKSRGFRR